MYIELFMTPFDVGFLGFSLWFIMLFLGSTSFCWVIHTEFFLLMISPLYLFLVLFCSVLCSLLHLISAVSQDWFQGKCAGKPSNCWSNYGFPLKGPFNRLQPIHRPIFVDEISHEISLYSSLNQRRDHRSASWRWSVLTWPNEARTGMDWACNLAVCSWVGHGLHWLHHSHERGRRPPRNRWNHHCCSC